MGSNDDAVAFLLERPPARLDVGLIARALQCRREGADPDSLFPVRRMLLSQIDACAFGFSLLEATHLADGADGHRRSKEIVRQGLPARPRVARVSSVTEFMHRQPELRCNVLWCNAV
jgi:hypothetical protein